MATNIGDQVRNPFVWASAPVPLLALSNVTVCEPRRGKVQEDRAKKSQREGVGGEIRERLNKEQTNRKKNTQSKTETHREREREVCTAELMQKKNATILLLPEREKADIHTHTLTPTHIYTRRHVSGL